MSESIFFGSVRGEQAGGELGFVNEHRFLRIRNEIARALPDPVVAFDDPRADTEIWQIAWLLHRSPSFDDADVPVMLELCRTDQDVRNVLRGFLLMDGLRHTIVKQIKTLLPNLRGSRRLVEGSLQDDDAWELAFLAECLRDSLATFRQTTAERGVGARLEIEKVLNYPTQLCAHLDAMLLSILGAQAMDVLARLGALRPA
jgi:hypothetical protein